MSSVTYRRVGDRWHIRFREKGRKEIVHTHPGTIPERTIAQRTLWWREQISLGRENPWQEHLEKKQLTATVGAVLEDFLQTNLDNGNWAESTYRVNCLVLRPMLERIAGMSLTEVTQDHFQVAFNEHPGSPHTKKSNRGRLNSFLSWLHLKEYTTRRFRVELSMRDVIEIRTSKKIKYLTWEQVNNICQAHRWRFIQSVAKYHPSLEADPELYCKIWWFMFYSLLRKEEVPRLKVRDLQGNRLRVLGKGRRADVITLPPPALEIAEEFAQGKAPDDHLFVTHMNRATVHLGKAIELALGPGHPKGFHQLRHGGVVYYLSIGIPIQFISKLARHRSIQVTMTVYADVLPDSMDEVFASVNHKSPLKYLQDPAPDWENGGKGFLENGLK